MSEPTLRRLAPGEFIGDIDGRETTTCGTVCFISDQPFIEPHEHADAHFVLVTDGFYATDARGADECIGPGAAIFNPPGTRHQDRFRGRGRLMTFTPGKDFLVANQAFACQRAPAVLAYPAAPRLLRAIGCEARARDALSDLTIEAAALELLACAGRFPAANRADPPPWLKAVRERMDDACGEAPAVAELAGEAGVHPVYLARAFRRFFGVSPGDYMRRRRATQAARLLVQTQMSLVEIALACGFADQAAFTKAFRKAVFTSPRAFRRRWTGG